MQKRPFHMLLIDQERRAKGRPVDPIASEMAGKLTFLAKKLVAKLVAAVTTELALAVGDPCD